MVFVVHLCLIQLKTTLFKMYNLMNFVTHIHSQNYHHNQDNKYVHYFQSLPVVLSRTSFTSFPTQPSPSHWPHDLLSDTDREAFPTILCKWNYVLFASFIQLMLHNQNTSSRWDFIMTFAKSIYVKSPFISLHNNSPMDLTDKFWQTLKKYLIFSF